MSRLLTLLAASDPGFVPSNYMPGFRVDIAFNAGYTTPDADRVWTDVSDWVELADGITDTFGRQDERSTADANDLTLVLDNSDGRFTAGRAASPHYPNVKVGRPIRLSLMTVTGYTSVRFVGFVNQWPVEWDGTDAYAKATITAGSRLSRLGLGRKMRSAPEEEILSAAPTGYWTLGDPSGATIAVDSSGTNGDPLPLSLAGFGSKTAVPPTFGNAIGSPVDGLTSAEFPGSVTTASRLQASSSLGTVRSIRVLFSGVAGSDSNTVLEVSGPAGFVGVRDDGSGNLAGFYQPAGAPGPTSMPGAGYAMDTFHDVVVTSTAAGSKFYVDGVLVDTDPGGLDLAGAGVTVGNTSVRSSFVIAHVAVYDVELTADQVAAQAEALLTGFAGERTDERAARLLGWAGVEASEIDAAVGDETMTYQQTAGQSVVDALRDVESTEGGVLFDGADGRVTFHNRSHRYTAPVAVTLDMAEQQVESDYAPKLDRSTLTNDVTVDNPTTGETARSVDAASVAEYGTATSSAKSVAASYDPLQQKAAWLVASYAEPRPRVPSLTVDVLAQVGGTPSAEDILALTIGSRIRVTNQPTQADTTDADYFVEGYSEAIGPESYRITFNLSPVYPHGNVLILDDPVRGLLDGSNLLAY